MKEKKCELDQKGKERDCPSVLKSFFFFAAKLLLLFSLDDNH